MLKYEQVKITDFDCVHEVMEEYYNRGYTFVSFFYKSDVYGLFYTYILFAKEK